MSFIYNPHRHVKIWLTKNKSIFLNIENQLRLIRMRVKNPNDEINFVYDSTLLTKESLADLTAFCLKHTILAHDVRSLFKECQSEEEKELIEIYEEEIKELNSGGNLAAASDVLRWISPIYGLGTYTDFDISIDTSMLPESIEVDANLLMNTGTVIRPNGVEFPVANNDFIAVVDGDSARHTVVCVQKGISRAYKNPESYKQIQNINIVNKHALMTLNYEDIAKRWKWFSMLTTYASSNYLVLVLETDPLILALGALSDQGPYKNKLELRKNFYDSLQDDQFIKQSVFKGANDTYRKRIKDQLTWFNWLFLPPSMYQELKKIVNMDNDTLLTYTRQTILDAFMKDVVMTTTGPGVVGGVLISLEDRSSPYSCEKFKEMSMYSYNLNESFKVTNTCAIGTSTKQLCHLFLYSNNVDVADGSWLAAGEKKIKKNEETMNLSATKIVKLLKKQVTLKKQSKVGGTVDSKPKNKGLFSDFLNGSLSNFYKKKQPVKTCSSKKMKNMP